MRKVCHRVGGLAPVIFAQEIMPGFLGEFFGISRPFFLSSRYMVAT